MNQYEISVLYHPDLEVDLSKSEERVKKIFTDNKGKITNTDNWGKKKLAYPIAKNEHAVYVFYSVDLPAIAVNKVESTFNITDEVIRFMITKVDHKAIAKAEAEKAIKAKRAKESSDNQEETEEVEDEKTKE